MKEVRVNDESVVKVLVDAFRLLAAIFNEW
jgi:hypothetical protein